jgi:hypothetical protein
VDAGHFCCSVILKLATCTPRVLIEDRLDGKASNFNKLHRVFAKYHIKPFDRRRHLYGTQVAVFEHNWGSSAASARAH